MYISTKSGLFKSKYIPGVRVECPGISGPWRVHFAFPPSRSFLFFVRALTSPRISLSPTHFLSPATSFFSTRNPIALYPLGYSPGLFPARLRRSSRMGNRKCKAPCVALSSSNIVYAIQHMYFARERATLLNP